MIQTGELSKHSSTVVMKGKFSYRDQNSFLYQAVKLGILTWGSMGIESILEPAQSGHSMNCSFWHFSIGFIFKHRRLLLSRKNWWNVNKYIYSSIVLKSKFKVLVLYLSLFFSCHFLLLRRYISERNIETVTALVTSYFTH